MDVDPGEVHGRCRDLFPAAGGFWRSLATGEFGGPGLWAHSCCGSILPCLGGTTPRARDLSSVASSPWCRGIWTTSFELHPATNSWLGEFHGWPWSQHGQMGDLQSTGGLFGDVPDLCRAHRHGTPCNSFQCGSKEQVETDGHSGAKCCGIGCLAPVASRSGNV